MLRCYISRVENGHTVPGVETLEKFCRAVGVELTSYFMAQRSRPEAHRYLRVEDQTGPLGAKAQDVSRNSDVQFPKCQKRIGLSCLSPHGRCSLLAHPIDPYSDSQSW